MVSPYFYCERFLRENINRTPAGISTGRTVKSSEVSGLCFFADVVFAAVDDDEAVADTVEVEIAVVTVETVVAAAVEAVVATGL